MFNHKQAAKAHYLDNLIRRTPPWTPISERSSGGWTSLQPLATPNTAAPLLALSILYVDASS